MTKGYIDLHVHTNASDGILSPQEVVEWAIKKKLKAIAITDHDTTDGFVDATQHTNQDELELIPGVELSCTFMDNDVHLLGYMFDYKNPEFVKTIKKFREERLVRGKLMVAKLNELGINLRMETVSQIAGKAAMGRPHIADALVREEYVRTYDEAFARYLGYHAPAYVPKKHLDVEHAINILHLIGGVAVLAHPGTLNHDEYIPLFVEMGLDGIEAFHSLHERRSIDHYKSIAKKYDMIFTGGSDCHGPRKGKLLLGSIRIPYEVLETMKKLVESR
jgi:predicted metal-dependent phosphoesterase TrpH